MIVKTVHLDVGIEHPNRGNVGWAKSYSADEFQITEREHDFLITREGMTVGVHKSKCAFWVYGEEKPAVAKASARKS